MTIYLTREAIENTLGCSTNRAKILMRNYRGNFKRLNGARLMDNKSIPTYFFIGEYAREHGVSERELCLAFKYDFKIYMKTWKVGNIDEKRKKKNA